MRIVNEEMKMREKSIYTNQMEEKGNENKWRDKGGELDLKSSDIYKIILMNKGFG